MKIWVISDTHGSLPDAAGDALKKCDYLIHAGDIGSEACYRAIFQLNLPSYLVRGNCDWSSYAADMQEVLSFHIDGISISLIHDLNRLSRLADDTDLVIFGHTHHYTLFERQCVTYLNPGSVSEGRGEPNSFVILDTDHGHFKVKQYTL